eukprot:GEZU01033264.1.p1 GENE.GEZU01033264.1~~GEZU01033264.1.p1  ORF type:complete len:166 (+),score=43.85 GEZU01033264.1:92-589(+)
MSSLLSKLPAFGTPEWQRNARSLYRRIMKLHHRKLPAIMRVLGNDYVREEWKLHKKATAAQAQQFIIKWEEYYDFVEKQPAQNIGRDLHDDEASKLTTEQRVQLTKLKEEAKQLRKAELEKRAAAARSPEEAAIYTRDPSQMTPEEQDRLIKQFVEAQAGAGHKK